MNVSELDKNLRRDIGQKVNLLNTFSDSYLEDLLATNGKSSYTPLIQILIPKITKEPYRNVKNYGILMDLSTTFAKALHGKEDVNVCQDVDIIV